MSVYPEDAPTHSQHIAADAPLEIKERAQAEMLDGIIEWAEGCYKEHPVEGMIFCTLHRNQDGSTAIQTFHAGSLTHYTEMMVRLGEIFGEEVKSAWERGQIFVQPFPPPSE
jgi:hypothetical protein